MGLMKVFLGNGMAARFGFALVFALSVVAAAPGGISVANAQDDAAEDENDPLEPMNRYFFELNKFFDTILLKPVATWYDGVVPEPGRDGVRNFLDNLRSPVILANDLLQGEWDRAGTTASRFGINTTVGVLGLFDPAAGWGFPQHSEDFGQTLGVYGTPEGPYLFVPVLGPAPPRDLTGFAVDQLFDPLTYIYWDRPKTVPVTRFVLNGIDQRARSLDTLDRAIRQKRGAAQGRPDPQERDRQWRAGFRRSAGYRQPNFRHKRTEQSRYAFMTHCPVSIMGHGGTPGDNRFRRSRWSRP